MLVSVNEGYHVILGFRGIVELADTQGQLG